MKKHKKRVVFLTTSEIRHFECFNMTGQAGLGVFSLRMHGEDYSAAGPMVYENWERQDRFRSDIPRVTTAR